MQGHPKRDAVRRAMQCYAAQFPYGDFSPRVIIVPKPKRTEPMHPLGSLPSPRRKPLPGVDVTAAFCGDAPPGRSALDQKRRWL